MAATGTVAAPPPFDPRGLYTAQIDVDVSKVEDELFVGIVIRAFNGTATEIRFSGIDGRIIYRSQNILRGDMRLPVPGAGFTPSKIEGYSEFYISLDQRVPKDCVAAFSSLLSHGSLELSFSSFKILIETDAGSFSLPLWEAVKVRSPDGISTKVSRVISARGIA